MKKKLYVFDTSSFSILKNIFPDRFPSFWKKFDGLIENERIFSVQEVRRELKKWGKKPLEDWFEKHKNIFYRPSPEETRFVSEIFQVQEFQTILKKKDRIADRPCADPFLIAAAKIKNARVVTEEGQHGGIRIPDICKYFKIDCTNLEGLMQEENWKF